MTPPMPFVRSEGPLSQRESAVTEQQIQAYLDGLAKPRGSLGRLEALALRLALIQQTLRPSVRPRRIVLFAGDHGVVASGVSAWPSAVTALMVDAILKGRATSSAFASAHDCSLRLVDVGVAADLPASLPPFFRDARIARGTRDLSVEPAMSLDEFDSAWQVGAEEAERAVAEGQRLLIAGEMGIGNTTPAACLTMLFTGISAESAVGRGAGADDSILALKRTIVAGAVAAHTAGATARGFDRAANDAADRTEDGADRAADRMADRTADRMANRMADRVANRMANRVEIAALAGFEIAAMAGFFATGAKLGATLLLDGYVATSAALIAEHLSPGTARSMIAGHRSAEPGHAAALAHLGLEPLLEWQMRLGEGTGALVALPLLDSAAALLRDVAPLSELGVARED